MIWFLTDHLRSHRERELIGTLEANSAWLTVLKWRFDGDLRLICDADIEAGGRVYPVTLRYPQHFPHSPPLVLPRGENERWSFHQWGLGGELCLEYGADNWHPDYTGADMLASAHRLLAGENPAPDQQATVPSRHETTLGQRLRGTLSRLYVTKGLAELLTTLPSGHMWKGTSVLALHRQAYVKIVHSVVLPDGETWKDITVPEQLVFESYERTTGLVRWPDDQPYPSIGTIAEFEQALAAQGIAPTDANYFLVSHGEKLRAHYLVRDDGAIKEVTVLMPQKEATRLDSEHLVLSGKKVGIVGCGSVGSKLAVMLARSGVGNFFLVDDDIVFPENIVRHELDWREVGTHKADSVARAIELVNPTAGWEIRRHRLGGQESGENVETLIGILGKCDLIIDATAEPRVFNYLCAASKSGQKPLVWAEAYGGGIGGMIARHRPGLEPDPASMRRIIESWCAEQGKPIERAPSEYGSRDAGVPLIADDADVTAIAAHAARLAIDTLIGRQPSHYPYAVYMIGLAPGWIFDEPFHTRPIEVGGPDVAPEIEVDPDLKEQELQRLGAMLAELTNETPPTSSDS